LLLIAFNQRNQAHVKHRCLYGKFKLVLVKMRFPKENIFTMQDEEWRDQDKIRQQFDYGPYPRIPIEAFPKDDYEQFFQHNLVTPYYLRHRRVADTQDKLILDAGCGSGYKALVLAAANPGAKIIGIDLSEQSLNLARQRFTFHKLNNAEFYQLKLEDIAQLGLQFDYINCDEVLYLLPDPAAGLQAMQAVLKPDGLIRANLHNAYERAELYRAQQLFKFIGLMDSAPSEFEQDAVVETMNALKDAVALKSETWIGRGVANVQPEKLREVLSTNFLLLNDKGYTIPDLFDLLEQANLEFVSMVNWRRWDVMDLFKQPDNLPALWGMGLADAGIQEKLHLFELLNPVHRLMDFWCTHPGSSGIPADQWSESEWQKAIIHLHPQLRTESFKQELIQAISHTQPFEISKQVKLPALAPVFLEASVAACLLPLWDGAQPIQVLVERFRQVRPIDPITLKPISEIAVYEKVKELLNQLDAFLYVLLEQA
jgi:2-polyprenyl-3-methyl-5-hydroxy-6-metoxy-1,4-benzoquinol methylase